MWYPRETKQHQAEVTGLDWGGGGAPGCCKPEWYRRTKQNPEFQQLPLNFL